jgi:hypothetical protein
MLATAPVLDSTRTRGRCIGALNRRSFFRGKELARHRGVPRCGHSVTVTCLVLHPWSGGRSDRVRCRRGTSDAGALLLGATDRAIGLVEWFAACFDDGRAAGLVEHTVE